MITKLQLFGCGVGLFGVLPFMASPAWASDRQITNIQVNPTGSGIAVILEMTNDTVVQTFTSRDGNRIVTDLTNTSLADRLSFRQLNPTADIAEVTVVPLTANQVRITIVGTSGEPSTTITQTDNRWTLNVSANAALVDPAAELSSENQAQSPDASAQSDSSQSDPSQSDSAQSAPDQSAPSSDATAQAEPSPDSAPSEPAGESVSPTNDTIRIVVTDEDEPEGYEVDRANAATRTDTPLRDVPRSTQVIPEQVLEDQQDIRLGDVLRNVSGVAQADGFGGTLDRFAIRGFSQDVFLRNGFRQSQSSLRETVNVERIEVLKGPASVLYGFLEPGGVVNLVTEQPLDQPAYSAELEFGSFGLFRPNVDLTGPITDDGALRYRLNAVFEGGGNFRDFDQETNRFFVAPVLAWDINDRTSLLLEFNYLSDQRPFDRGIVAIGEGIADIPYERVLGHPDDESEIEEVSIGYQLEHRFSDDWVLRNGIQFTSSNTFNYRADSWFIQDTGQLDRRFRSNDDRLETLDVQTNISGNFATGPIDHTLLFGVDFGRTFTEGTQRALPNDPDFPISIFDPDLGDRPSLSELTNFTRDNRNRINTVGLYLQDQIDLTDNLILVLGGRVDFFDQSVINNLTSSEFEQNDTAFSPQVGLVYQPIEPISLYGSFSRSFVPSTSTRADGSPLDPERGTQFEVGIRGEFLDGRLTANLAAYELTKSNIATGDPDNPDFSIPVGEVRSRGIEFDVTGQLAPGWNIIASYANIDAEITKDNSLTVGNALTNVPRNSASLWSTYEIQSGSLQGLGFGAGLFFVSDRPGDLDNSFEVPSYVRTDAAVFYRRDNWRVALNIKNLFDIDYIDNSEGFREYVNPGEPLTIVGSISVSF